MKYLVPVTVLLLLLVLTPTSADTFELSLPWATGQYEAGGPVSQVFDFGRSFASINSLSMHWSGNVVAGLYTRRDLQTGLETDHPYMAQFEAFTDDGGQNLRHLVATNVLGGTTYPSAEAFDTVGLFGEVLAHDYDYLLDGTATLWFQFQPTYFPADASYIIRSNPVGQLDQVTLILDATPVPEPSGLLALATFAVTTAGMLIRGRRRSQ